MHWQKVKKSLRKHKGLLPNTYENVLRKCKRILSHICDVLQKRLAACTGMSEGALNGYESLSQCM